MQPRGGAFNLGSKRLRAKRQDERERERETERQTDRQTVELGQLRVEEEWSHMKNRDGFGGFEASGGS